MTANIFGGKVTWRDLLTWADMTWDQNVYAMCGIDVLTGAKFGGAARRRFFLTIVENPKGVILTPSHPGEG